MSPPFVVAVAVAVAVALFSAAFVARLSRERQRATQALEHSETLFRSLVENAIDIVAVLDHAGRILYVSPSVERILGYRPEQLKGKVALELVAEADKPMVAASFAAGLKQPGTSHSATCTMLDQKGEPHVLETRGAAVLFGGTIQTVLSLRDVTAERRATEDQQRLQAQLVHAQKLEAFGTLAKGIAHDFNNLLTPILAGAELGRGTLPADNPARELFDRIEESARRARALVQRMVLLGKSSSDERKLLDLTELVRDATELLRAALPRTITLTSALPHDKLVVMGDDVQLQQALLNLTTNAAHAMRKMRAGELTVRLAPLGAMSPARRKHPILRGGDWAHIEISDTGEGMDEATARRAFEPFFSTHAQREVGGGAGLGLAVVHGVVNGHGGVIDLTSAPAQGTRVEVYLPLRQQVARVSSDEVQKAGGETKARILLVDDEPAVASVCRELLKMLGYEVDVSNDPREALERFAATPDRFDLVVTDHSMPHLTGLQLAEALAPMREARVPIVLTTGFAHEDVLSTTNRALIAEVVPKPYAIEELESAIVRALSARAS